MGLAEAREQPGNVDVAGGLERADPDAPTPNAAKLVDLRSRILDLGQDATRPGGKRGSGFGRDDATAGAFEERRTQLLLETTDLVGERRLGDVELIGGAREMAMAGYRLDTSQLPELHTTMIQSDRFGENYDLCCWIAAVILNP